MTKKLIAVLAMSFALSACESSTPENAPNTNANPPGAAASSTPAAAPATPAPEASPAAKVELKAGDKVKVNNNGTTAEATVVSVDEKAGKITVRIAGEKQDKTVALADLVKK